MCNKTYREIRNSDELEFMIFCIENLAIKLCITGTQVYNMLTEKKQYFK